MQFEYLPPAVALLLPLVLAAPVVWLGLRAMNWASPQKQAVAIGLRVGSIVLMVMLLAGVRWQRWHHDLEVMVVRDVSASTAGVPAIGRTIQSDIDSFLVSTGASRSKPAADRLGVVRFDAQPRVDFLPQYQFRPGQGAVLSDSSSGSDIASAINLAMACFSGDAMKRLVLISDGNATQSGTSEAVAAAVAAHVPIDVIPLRFRIDNEVMLERIAAPSTLRIGEAYGIDVILRSTNAAPVSGKISITQAGHPVDLDQQTPGMQLSIPAIAKPGATAVHVRMPSATAAGLVELRASFQPDDLTRDALAGNNSADSFSLVSGRGRILYVDNVADGEGNELLAALQSQGKDAWTVDQISPAQFPSRLVELESYDAVILANVPRGPSGIDDAQARLLSQYVHDTGGGLIVLGGPDALGAGGWDPQSPLAEILPVNLDVPAERVLPAGALVLVLDHSGSMSGAMPLDPGITKQFVANESAALAVLAMQLRDWVGVIAFDGAPQWVVELAENRDPRWAAGKIRAIAPAGGTSIGPALEEAYQALSRMRLDQASVRRILLLTDGKSQPFAVDSILQKLNDAKIVLSTVGMGADADRTMLADLASRGGGAAYFVDDPHVLRQIFVREARTLRRQLIHEPKEGIKVVPEPAALSASEMLGSMAQVMPPDLSGIVLTSRKIHPQAAVLFSANNRYHDPILARWQTGLGRAAVFTGDATRKWAANWVGSGDFASFWGQVVRTIARPALNTEFDVTTVRDGNRTKLVVETPSQDGASRSFYNFSGRLVSIASKSTTGEDSKPLQLQQTGPGHYETWLDTADAGNYVAVFQFSEPGGKTGTLLAGATVGSAPETRDLKSNDALLTEIATSSGGRILSSLDADSAGMLFSREGLTRSSSSMPLREVILAALLGMIVLDVAARRIAWDRLEPHSMMLAAVAAIRSRTTTTKVDSKPTLQALKRVRRGLVQQRADSKRDVAAATPVISMPDPAARFEPLRGVRGNIEDVVGGAKNRYAMPAMQPEVKNPTPAGAGNSLLEAKRRAQRQIRLKEQGNG